ncbi:MAG: septum formation protein Maf [Deltaproteobacteria bacterium]|nr:septum formation protein Maf [Deltaproteobacteria bacterium]
MKQNKRLILASASKRRRELLGTLHIPFDIFPSAVEEVIDPELSPEENALNLAKLKAHDVANDHSGLILGCDTLVATSTEIIGKPLNEKHACEILGKLSGIRHRVISGLCLLDTFDKKEFCDVETTYVTFRKLTNAEILHYVRHHDVYDKSGSYALQEIGESFVTKIEGSESNIIGLPMEKLLIFLRQVLGVKSFVG